MDLHNIQETHKSKYLNIVDNCRFVKCIWDFIDVNVPAAITAH